MLVKMEVVVLHLILAHVQLDGNKRKKFYVVDLICLFVFERTGATCTTPTCTPTCQNNGTCIATNVCNWFV